MRFKELVEKSQNIEAYYKVTPEVYNSFQKLSNDFNPLHTDESFAQMKGFNQCVMYGNILNGFISHFVGMVLPSRDVMIQTQDIWYRKPIYLNDEILLKSEIDTYSDAVEIINYKLRFFRTDNGGGKLLLVASGHVQIGTLK
nr:MaoC/PaaZ C-terminal domain-containing protein [Bacteroides intestinalis]